MAEGLPTRGNRSLKKQDLNAVYAGYFAVHDGEDFCASRFPGAIPGLTGPKLALPLLQVIDTNRKRCRRLGILRLVRPSKVAWVRLPQPLSFIALFFFDLKTGAVGMPYIGSMCRRFDSSSRFRDSSAGRAMAGYAGPSSCLFIALWCNWQHTSLWLKPSGFESWRGNNNMSTKITG